jgi:SAM-dependent methyltransferase
VLRLNLGCGSICHPDWINLDFIASRPDVVACDLRKPLPFADASADACYASHVLEHFGREHARAFLMQCRRVLRSGGVVRIVVPDLENIATAYLGSMDQSAANHDWMTLELIDQMVRTAPGGEIHKVLTSGGNANADFIVSRVGLDAEALLAGKPQSTGGKPGWRHYLRRLREKAAGVAAGLVLGREGYDALNDGLFRRSGQVHLWMYDRVSLAALLIECGFASPRVCKADDSAIAGFSGTGFDVVQGRVRKPDSLFMEAVRP